MTTEKAISLIAARVEEMKNHPAVQERLSRMAAAGKTPDEIIQWLERAALVTLVCGKQA